MFLKYKLSLLLIYRITSIVTVFVNKALLSGDTVNLDAPLFVTWFQCVVSAAICYALSHLGRRYQQWIHFPVGSPMQWSTFRQVVPLSIMFTLMIATNNLCLKYVAVAFYYVGRSLTTVFNVLLSWILLRQRTSFGCIMCCALIVFGFALGVDQESVTESFSLLGTVFGVLGSISLSLYSIYTKKTLPLVNGEVWLLSYYNNVYSSVLFLPLIVATGELPAIIGYEHLFRGWFWLAMCVGGVCGLAIGFVTALQIKVTSPLTHNISGTAKACAQTVLATQWFNEVKSGLWWTSNGIVLLGSAMYARLKQLEMERAHRQNSPVGQKI